MTGQPTSISSRILSPRQSGLRSEVFVSDLYIGEASREIGDPVLDLLNGVKINPAPYLARRPLQVFRASGSPESTRARLRSRGTRASRVVSPQARHASPGACLSSCRGRHQPSFVAGSPLSWSRVSCPPGTCWPFLPARFRM
jgi:hypothetical protein